MTEKLSIIGSTGSIGVNALKVAKNNGMIVTALCASKNVSVLEQQIREFKPKIAALSDENAAKELKSRCADLPVKIYSGKLGVEYCAAESDCDTVLNSIVGIAGLMPTLAAIRSHKNIALANKETLVAGGEIVIREAKANGVKILPVDSEHSAIFQSLQCSSENAVNKIILTASGGPFFGMKAEQLRNITPVMALKHPNWTMGAKITIDSATLMNKGLEVIEAVHLFAIPASKIQVVVHRQSILHSAVEFVDGGIIGQFGVPDMKLPIQYALTYPSRKYCETEQLDLIKCGTLTFEKADTDTFLCLKTCIDAINSGGLKPAAANGANEIAVELFLKEKISFLQIGELVAAATAAQPVVSRFSLEDVFSADKAARELVLSLI